MPIDYERLMSRTFPDTEATYSTRDTILYALSVGAGQDPADERQLQFVYEKNLRAVPTIVCVLGYRSIRELDLGVDYSKVVHARQRIELYKSIPVSGTIVCKLSLADVIDRGDRGAAIHLDRRIVEKSTGDVLAVVTMEILARNDGGFGGPKGQPRSPRTLPDRAPDLVCQVTTLPQSALLYRLNGDANPLHADPEIARRAGFQRPIFHGLGTYGFLGNMLVGSVCDYDASRLRAFSGRFSAPVYPGEEIAAEIWVDGEDISIRGRVHDRDVVVFDNGHAIVSARGT